MRAVWRLLGPFLLGCMQYVQPRKTGVTVSSAVDRTAALKNSSHSTFKRLKFKITEAKVLKGVRQGRLVQTVLIASSSCVALSFLMSSQNLTTDSGIRSECSSSEQPLGWGPI